MLTNYIEELKREKKKTHLTSSYTQAWKKCERKDWFSYNFSKFKRNLKLKNSKLFEIDAKFLKSTHFDSENCFFYEFKRLSIAVVCEQNCKWIINKIKIISVAL